jgi:hypothetical protein
MKNVFLVLFITITGVLNAQTDFRKGKIIQLNGDTLCGELNFQGDIQNSKLIRFRNHELDSIFEPFDIRSYYFENGKFYTSKIAIIDADTVKIFAEYLVFGIKDLFFNRSSSSFNYLISVSDSVIHKIPYKVEIVNVDGVNYQKESKHFIGYLKSYFHDCPSIFSKIDELKSPERKSLVSIIKEYHDITCGEGTCIVYDRKEYPIKIAIEPVYSYFIKNIMKSDNIVSAVGGHLYLWMPNSSERFYLKTGLHFASQAPYTYYQIPLQFEYVYPFKVIKPKFDVGVNAHFVRKSGVLWSAGLSTLVNAGCYVELTKWMYLDFDVSTDLFFFLYETGVFENITSRMGLCFVINGKNNR